MQIPDYCLPIVKISFIPVRKVTSYSLPGSSLYILLNIAKYSSKYCYNAAKILMKPLKCYMDDDLKIMASLLLILK